MGDAVKKVFEMIKDNDVAFVDFRFTDPRGKWQHTAQTVNTVEEEVFEDGAQDRFHEEEGAGPAEQGFLFFVGWG